MKSPSIYFSTLLLLGIVSHLHAKTTTWIGGVGNWDVAGNWDMGVPTKVDSAVIRFRSDTVTIQTGTAAEVKNLDIRGTLHLLSTAVDSATLVMGDAVVNSDGISLFGSLNNAGVIEIYNSTGNGIILRGSLVNTGRIYVSDAYGAGIVAYEGTLTNHTQIVLDTCTVGLDIEKSIAHNHGTIKVNSSEIDGMRIFAESEMTNHTLGIIVINGVSQRGLEVRANALLENEGTLRLKNTQEIGFDNAGMFINSDSLILDNTSLDPIWAGLQNGSIFINESSGIVQVTNSFHTAIKNVSMGTFTNYGKIIVDDCLESGFINLADASFTNFAGSSLEITQVVDCPLQIDENSVFQINEQSTLSAE